MVEKNKNKLFYNVMQKNQLGSFGRSMGCTLGILFSTARGSVLCGGLIVALLFFMERRWREAHKTIF